MERVGVLIDTEALQKQSEELEKDLEVLKEEITRECGRELNLNSTQELQKVLFEERGLEPLRKTPQRRAASTAEDVLEELAALDVLPGMILNYRQQTKLLSTYVGKLPQMINPETGRLHTSFHQAGHGDRAAIFVRPEFAEYSNPNGTGPAGSPGFRRAPGMCPDCSRLFADRTSHHGPYLERSDLVSGLPGKG